MYIYIIIIILANSVQNQTTNSKHWIRIFDIKIYQFEKGNRPNSKYKFLKAFITFGSYCH